MHDFSFLDCFFSFPQLSLLYFLFIPRVTCSFSRCFSLFWSAQCAVSRQYDGYLLLHQPMTVASSLSLKFRSYFIICHSRSICLSCSLLVVALFFACMHLLATRSTHSSMPVNRCARPSKRTRLCSKPGTPSISVTRHPPMS